MDDQFVRRERAVCELCAIIVCIAEEVEVEEMGFEAIVEFFFFVFFIEVLVHLGEREACTRGGKVPGEGEDFGGHV
jgi:hypothetical protein